MKRGKPGSSRPVKRTPHVAGDEGLAMGDYVTSIVDSSDDAIITKDLQGRITSWNPAAEQLFGYRAAEIIGEAILRLIPEERAKEEREILASIREGGRIHHYETVRLRKDGKRVDVSVSISPVRNKRGTIVGACKIARDITERKNLDLSRRESEQLVRAILETAADPIITITDRGMIHSLNAATERLFGYTAAELIDKNVSMLMPEPFHGEHDSYMRRYAETGQAKIIGIGREVMGRKKSGEVFPMHLAVGEVRVGERRLFTGIIHDLSERRLLEQRVIDAAVAEQRRIGQDIHDGLCQDLVGIAFSLDSIGNGRRTGEGLEKALSEAAVAVRAAASQARDLSHGLNPVDIRAGGLGIALEHLCLKLSEAFGVKCAAEYDEAVAVSDDGVATHLFRIAQEATSNAIRHGEARHVWIHLFANRTQVVLTITDNGAGIPRELADRFRQGLPLSGDRHAGRTGIGLETMQYRARVVGGVLSIEPRAGGGTVVSCAIGREMLAVKRNGTKARGRGVKRGAR